MKVLIFGASGYIGLPVAQALVRAGHTVYGHTRSEKKGKALAKEEIIPVTGDTLDSASWIDLISTLDAVIDVTAGNDLETLGKSLLKLVTDAVGQHRPPHAPKITYVYTSGIWMHGDSKTNIVNDTTPITSPLPLVAWRPAIEQAVMTNTAVNGVVVRAPLVYGRSGSLTGMLFRSAYKGKTTWYGQPGARAAVIHQDDLADVYLRVVERGQLVKGLAFDVSSGPTESVDDILARLTEVSGAKEPYEYVTPTNPFEEALASTVILQPYLARVLLDWQPRRLGFVDNLELFYNTWKVNAGLS